MACLPLLAQISIHSLRARGDIFQLCNIGDVLPFQSTPLVRGETSAGMSLNGSRKFQSTPLMRGETRSRSRCRAALQDFNPLPSCEGRRLVNKQTVDIGTFQSTPLMRGETLSEKVNQADLLGISIHSPHARGDHTPLNSSDSQKKFQSTPLMRGETIIITAVFHLPEFQSTPLMRGETWTGWLHSVHRQFQSTPLMRGETSG